MDGMDAGLLRRWDSIPKTTTVCSSLDITNAALALRIKIGTAYCLHTYNSIRMWPGLAMPSICFPMLYSHAHRGPWVPLAYTIVM